MAENKDWVKAVVNSYSFLAFLIVVGLLNIILQNIWNILIGLVAIVYSLFILKRKLSSSIPQHKLEAMQKIEAKQ